MSDRALRVAVVGHTNTGKTSLMRTLTRDVAFGEVSDEPSTTRHVEGAALVVDGKPLLELYDTPGLEDPIGLLECLERLRPEGRLDGIDLIGRFLDSEYARTGYAQEAKALRQVLDCDVAIYVIDARDRVLAKHRDELEILGRCARPVVPVLNFVASAEARPNPWREQLARVGLHALAEFDTVVLDGDAEERLYRKLQMLMDSFHTPLDTLIEHLARERTRLKRSSADVIAELLLEVCGFVVSVSGGDRARVRAALETLREHVRRREQACVSALLELHRFRLHDALLEELPIEDGRWGLDLFSSEALRQFGFSLGGAAATGAAAGLAVDALLGGLSLGAGALTGAAIGAVYQTTRSHGKRLASRLRGQRELRVDDSTLGLLATRQVHLLRALLHRGHASQVPIRVTVGQARELAKPADRLGDLLTRARSHPEWSQPDGFRDSRADADRVAMRDRLADAIEVLVEY